MIKISIIIPVYNTEFFLCQCLDSVCEQSLSDIEIICINDGSVDKSGKILDEYAQKDNRFKIIHKTNGGSVSARKAGLHSATGKYVGFVDSDDWVEPNMFEELYNLAERYQVDMVSTGYYMEGNYTTMHYDGVEGGLYADGNLSFLLDNYMYCLKDKAPGLRGSLCNKLFLRNKFADVQRGMSEKMLFSEDKMCVLSYLLECVSVFVQKKAYYHYRINTDSMVHKPNTEYLIYVNEVYQFLKTLYTHPNFTIEMRKQAELYITELLIMGINTRLGFENRNVLWIDPYWLDKLPQNSRIVLYGSGELGRKYKRHLDSRKDCTYVACVDSNYEKNTTEEFPILPVEQLLVLEYDYVVITIKNPTKAAEVKVGLKSMIPKEKILWFEQPEIFWKYAEADGLL